MEAALQALVQQILGPLGLTIGLILVVVGGVLEWWVPGRRYRQDLSDWKAIAERALLNAEANTDLLEEIVGMLDDRPVRRRRPPRGPA